MQWESTDQFGNMFIGVSKSRDVKGLRSEILSMLSELNSRNEGGYTVTVDFAYGEINGPNPHEVSHVLQVEWLSDCDDHTTMMLEFQDMVASICLEKGWSEPTVESA